MPQVRVSAYDRPLFSGESLPAKLREHLKATPPRVVGRIDAGDVIDLDVDAWIDEVMQGEGLPPLVLDRQSAYLLDRPAGSPAVLAIPIEGKEAWVELDPEKDPDSRVHMRGGRPKGYVENGVLFRELGLPSDVVSADTMVDRSFEELKPWIERVNALITDHNATLRVQIREHLATRQEREKKARAFYEGASLPVRRRGDAPKVFKKSPISKKPSPTEKSAQAPAKPAYALTDEYYDHIITVVRAAGRAMSRSPSTYKGWGEEDRRQAILLMLNTHYSGQAQAEAFNGQGKTDILIRIEDRNVFIAECFMWGGPETLISKLGQLFGYTTWEDAKLAIISFVDRKDLTKVLESGKRALVKHDQVKTCETTDVETELRCRVLWPGDPDRELDLHVFFIHVA